MEKIIKIDGREVRFMSRASLPLRYKAQFGRDLFADMAKLEHAENDITKLDTEVFYNIIWTMAKLADDIPPLVDWLDTFNSFPVLEVFNELQDVFAQSFKPTKN